MPQLDISTFLSQFFWLIISFAFLYLILSQFFLPKLINISQERDRHILEALAISEKNKTEAYLLKAEYEKNFTEAVQQKNASINNALKDISLMMDAKLAEHNHQLSELVKNSEHNMQDFKKQSSTEVKQIAIEATQNIISTLFDLKLDKTDITKIVEEQYKLRGYDA